MASLPPKTDSTHTQEELEKKLSDIGLQNRALAAQQLAQDLGLTYMDLQGLPIDPEALRKVSEEEARQTSVALVQVRGNTAIAAALDPRTPEAKSALEKLRVQFPHLSVIIVSPATFSVILDRYETIKTADTFEVGSIKMDAAVLDRAQQNIKNVDDLKSQIEGVNVTQLFEILIAGALATKASDIHIEPEAGDTRLRYRLDGLLHDIVRLDHARYQRLVSRIKVLSKMKLNIVKAPQDGRFTIEQDDIAIEVRVSLLPSEYGESFVMRLLDPRNIRTHLEELGMRPDILKQVRTLLAKPQGTLLTTGPTGSGKTTTLYAFVNELNTSDTKIITVEDPIEYHITGISQTQVEPEKDYTFASGLRAIVRQDPDIILIGEIRDLETAEIALNAALTGHLVLSTIHTNDAAGTVPRLIDIGARAESVAPALTMAMGQRLLRKLCPHCKKTETIPSEDLEKISTALDPVRERLNITQSPKEASFFGPVGCTECNGIGYRGRVGVYEVFEVTREMERLILSNPAVSDVRDLAVKEGMVTMIQDGYLKMIEGITSLEEVRRVLG
jgi:type IV pilus assembly protein PilB